MKEWDREIEDVLRTTHRDKSSKRGEELSVFKDCRNRNILL